MIKMRDPNTDQLAFYGHLSWIANMSPWYPYVPQGITIAGSGDSGAGGRHLHFHVEKRTGGAIQLNGMTDLSLNSQYPDCDKPKSDCDIPDGFQCNCGSVN